MSGKLAWRNGNYTDEEGATRHLSKLFSAGVIGSASLAVTQRGAGANMSVDVAAGESFLDSGLGYWYPGWNPSTRNIPLNASDPSNPRRTLIVEYANLSIADTGNNNAPTAWELMAVDGTAAASPSDPSAATIQAAVGAGNPYRTVARIAVGAGVTSIVTANITDLRTLSKMPSSLLSVASGAFTNSEMADRTRSFICHIQPGSTATTLSNFGATIALADETTQQVDFAGVVPKDCVTGTATLVVYYTASATGNISTKLYCWSKSANSAMGAAGNQYDNSAQTLTAAATDTIYRATFALSTNISADQIVSGSLVRATGDANAGALRIKAVTVEYTADM